MGLITIFLEVNATNMKADTSTGLIYPDLLNRFFSVKGNEKFSGLAPVSSFTPLEYTNAKITYQLGVDTLRYPEIKDYAEVLNKAFEETIIELKPSYKISKTGGDKPIDSLTFSLEPRETMASFEEKYEQAQMIYGQELIDQYISGNKEVRDALLEKYSDIKELAERKDPSIKKKAQTVSTAKSPSVPETKLAQEALKTETTTPVTNVTVTTEVPQKQEPSPLQPIVTPVITSPVERTTTLKEKESTSDRTFIESISNAVFDNRIMEYDRSLIKSTEKYQTSPSPATTIASSPVSYSQGLLQNNVVNQKTSTSLQGKTISSALENVLGPNAVIVPFQIPSTTSEQAPTAISTERATTIDNRINESTIRESSVVPEIISSLNSTIKQIESSIGTFSNIVQDREKETGNGINNIVNQSLPLLGLSPSTIFSSIEKLNDLSVISEKAESQNNVLQNMTNRVVETEILGPIKGEMTSMVENIGNSIKNAITNITMVDRKSTEERVSSPAPIIQTPIVSPVMNQEGNNETSLQAPNIQSFASVGGGMPTVVSLSQTTIDNLASAIIKNMSISSFLNSGT